MPDSMRVFVTGGTGFVGRRLVRALLAGGAQVSVLARAGSDLSALPPDARRVAGELGSRRDLPAQLCDELSRADAVIHCAARLFAGDWKEYLRDNCLGTEHLAGLIAACGNNVRRVIMFSSLAAAGPCGKAPGRAEDAPPSPVSAYGWSKLMAEWAMEKHVGKERLIILRPPVVYGPGDRALAPLFALASRGLVLQAGRREAPCSFLYVDDLVEAAGLCLRAPRAAGVYHLEDGRPSSLGEFGDIIARAAGRRPRRVAVPHALLRLAAMGGAAAGRCLPKFFFPLTPDKALEARQKGWLADGGKFRRDFAFTARTPLEAGVAATLGRRKGER